MNPTLTFGAFLAVCREVPGKTQAQIAAACAVTPKPSVSSNPGAANPSSNACLP
jgi:hypothetical protein